MNCDLQLWSMEALHTAMDKGGESQGLRSREIHAYYGFNKEDHLSYIYQTDPLVFPRLETS